MINIQTLRQEKEELMVEYYKKIIADFFSNENVKLDINKMKLITSVSIKYLSNNYNFLNTDVVTYKNGIIKAGTKFDSFWGFVVNNLYKKSRLKINKLYQDKLETIKLLDELTRFFDVNNHEIFTSFKLLVEYLKIHSYSSNDIFELILLIINTNNFKMEQRETELIVPDLSKIGEFNFKHLDALDLKYSRSIKDYLAFKYSFEKDEYYDYLSQFNIDLSKYKKVFLRIEEIITNMQENAYDELVNLLDIIGLSSISYKWINKLKKENKKDEIKLEIKPVKQPKNAKKINPKEEKKLVHEINKYYDISNKSLIKILSLDEIIYVTYLLKKLSIEHAAIDEFIFLSEKDLRKNSDIINVFNMFYDKVYYYQEYITDELSQFRLYLNKLIASQSDLEYIESKKQLFIIMNEILKILEQKNEYEYEEVKKLQI